MKSENEIRQAIIFQKQALEETIKAKNFESSLRLLHKIETLEWVLD